MQIIRATVSLILPYKTNFTIQFETYFALREKGQKNAFNFDSTYGSTQCPGWTDGYNLAFAFPRPVQFFRELCCRATTKVRKYKFLESSRNDLVYHFVQFMFEADFKNCTNEYAFFILRLIVRF